MRLILHVVLICGNKNYDNYTAAFKVNIQTEIFKVV